MNTIDRLKGRLEPRKEKSLLQIMWDEQFPTCPNCREPYRDCDLPLYEDGDKVDLECSACGKMFRVTAKIEKTYDCAPLV